MQPGFVVPEQPRDSFILGLASGHEALAVQALDLQRAEQRFTAGIDAPIVCTPAHRAQDAVVLERISESAAGVLTAPVAVEQHPGALVRLAPEPGHAQRVDDDV